MFVAVASLCWFRNRLWDYDGSDRSSERAGDRLGIEQTLAHRRAAAFNVIWNSSEIFAFTAEKSPDSSQKVARL